MIYKVLMTDKNPRHDMRPWVNLETDYETLGDLYRTLRDEGVIYGMRLFTRPDPDTPRTYLVTGSAPVVLGVAAVYSVEVPNAEYAAEEGVKL